MGLSLCSPVEEVVPAVVAYVTGVVVVDVCAGVTCALCAFLCTLHYRDLCVAQGNQACQLRLSIPFVVGA